VKDSPMPAVALLALTLICATVLTAMGVLSRTEMLPLFGGAVVVAHRMLDGAMIRRKAGKDASASIPPSAGVPVVLGMLGAGLAGTMGPNIAGIF